MMGDRREEDSATLPSEPSGRLYNPYADLYPNLDARSAQGLYQLPDAPEYVFAEEAATQRRGFSDNLTFYTGVGYLSGAILGGGRGLVEGVRSQEAGDTAKLRINRILNASGHKGRTAGNTLGVLGLLYGGMEGAACYYRDRDDVWNNVIAGLGTGAFYKVSAGPRAAAIAGAVGGAAAALLAAGKHVGKRYLAF